MNELKEKLTALHDRAKLDGLNVRFWDAQRTALVIALPVEKPEPVADPVPPSPFILPPSGPMSVH